MFADFGQKDKDYSWEWLLYTDPGQTVCEIGTSLGHALTHSHTMTPFDVPWKQAF